MIDEKRKRANELLETVNSKTKRKKLLNQIESYNEASQSEDSLKDYYKEWRTFQASHHLPLWVEIEIDFSEKYLEYLKTI